MSDDRQPCPTCHERREVLYTWRAGVLLCQCRTCGATFALPVRDERAAQDRALATVRSVAAKARGKRREDDRSGMA